MNIVRLYEDVFRIIGKMKGIPLCPSRPFYEEIAASIAIGEIFSCNQFAACRKGRIPLYYIDTSMTAGLCDHADEATKLTDIPFWCRSCPLANYRFGIPSEIVPDIISTARNAVSTVYAYNKDEIRHSRHVVIENFWSDGSIAVKPIGRLPLGRRTKMEIIQNLRTLLTKTSFRHAEVFLSKGWPERAIPIFNTIPEEIQTASANYNAKVPEENRIRIVSYFEGNVFIAIHEKQNRLWTINKDLRIRRALEILFSHYMGKPITVVLVNQ